MIGNIAQFWRLTRELDLGAIRAEFERQPTLYVLGSDQAAAERVARLVAHEAIGHELRPATLSTWSEDRRQAGPGGDLVLVGLGSPPDGAARRALGALTLSGRPLLLVQLCENPDLLVLGIPPERLIALKEGDDDESARARILEALVRLAPEVMLPLGRSYPRLRPWVAEQLIRDSARANAQFAALSSLPANIPLLGGLVGDMADILVLTKNQVILLFKLAGLYGRDLALGARPLVEVVPVVGGAFVWRSTARALVGLLPGFVAALPKAIVAYTGTYVVGELARYYYQHGRQAPPEVVRELGARGTRLAREAVERLARRGPRC